MRKVKVTKQYIDRLKSELEDTKKQLSEVEDDRRKFRVYFLKMLKENVAMNSKNEYYSSSTMITSLSQLMNSVKNWYWS